MQLSCHCGNVKIEVEAPVQVTECNCSICSRYASLWGYYDPAQPDISVGSHGTDSYAWGDKDLDFIRCSNCGCVTHYQTRAGRGEPRVAINFGLDRGAVRDVPVRYFDGAEEL
jgi:hypothetical protein